jgi:hypothetical protein
VKDQKQKRNQLINSFNDVFTQAKRSVQGGYYFEKIDWLHQSKCYLPDDHPHRVNLRCYDRKEEKNPTPKPKAPKPASRNLAQTTTVAQDRDAHASTMYGGKSVTQTIQAKRDSRCKSMDREKSVPRTKPRVRDEEMSVMTVTTKPEDIFEVLSVTSNDSQGKKQFLKKGEKSRRVYDPKQAISKQKEGKRDLIEKAEKIQIMY